MRTLTRSRRSQRANLVSFFGEGSQPMSDHNHYRLNERLRADTNSLIGILDTLRSKVNIHDQMGLTIKDLSAVQ
jgi:hypothetical protein